MSGLVAAVQLREKIVHAADGTALYVEDCMLEPQRQAATLVIMHGLGEHLGRYAHVVKFFNDCGISVRTYDHRGHGKSDGPRGDVPNGEPILQDAQIIIEDFTDVCGQAPLLLGHSMGGLFAARFALEHLAPLRGLILSSPALAVDMAGWQMLALKIMRKLAPGLGLPNGLSPKFLSHDAAVIKAYRADPLVHGRLSAHLLSRILAATEYCQQHAHSLSLPCCLLVAGDDHLVQPQGSYDFAKLAPPALLHCKIYPEMYHELFNELDAQLVFNDVRDWLLAQGFIHDRDLPA